MSRLSGFDTVVWDFNGTLLDDVSVGIHAVNVLLRRRGLPTLRDREAYFAVFGFPIEGYYRRLGFDFEKEPYEALAVEWVREYRIAEKDAALREGTVALLDRLRSLGVRQIVLSATEEGMLEDQLLGLGIRGYFDEVLGRSDIYAADKTAIARAYADAHPERRCLMIGDTSHDLEAARAAGFAAILLRGGHSSDEALDQLGCEIVRDLPELERRLLSDADD